MEAVVSRSTPSRAESTRVASTPTVWRDQAILSVLVFWMAMGLAVDTRRHRTDASLDTFFTSAHGLLYAGWLACSVFTLYVIRRHRAAGASLRDSVPRGLECAVGGAVMFGVGGVGDLIWHTKFGIERNLKILFSPTHLFLMTAMLMLSFGPIRVLWMSRQFDDVRPSLARFWPVAVAGGSLTSVLIVFFQYVSPLERPIFTSDIPNAFNLGAVLKGLGIVSIIITTALLFGMILLLARRWRVPFGTFLVAFAVVAVSIFVFTDFKATRLLLSLLIGALLCDVLQVVAMRTLPPRIAYRVVGAAGPLLLWSTYIALTAAQHRITWEAELWTGSVVWSGLVGLGLTVLLLPPRATPASYLD